MKYRLILTIDKTDCARLLYENYQFQRNMLRCEQYAIKKLKEHYNTNNTILTN